MRDNEEVSQIHERQKGECLTKIVNNLYSSKEITNESLEPIIENLDPVYAVPLGLAQLLYNTSLSPSPFDECDKLKQKGNNFAITAKVLKIRGQILRYWALYLKKMMPQPAYSYARFNFEKFNAYCLDRGLTNLMRHIKGLYPPFNVNNMPIFQFLPFQEEIKKGGYASSVAGNKNWMMAKKIVNSFYQQQIKNNKFEKLREDSMKKSSRIQGKEKEDTLQADSQKLKAEQQKKRGIKICYMLITEEYEQLEREMTDYIKNNMGAVAEPTEMQADGEVNSQQIDRFAFWIKNYQKFIEQGLQFYKNHENSDIQIPPLTIESQNNFQGLIIKTIVAIFQYKGSQKQEQQEKQAARKEYLKLQKQKNAQDVKQNLNSIVAQYKQQIDGADIAKNQYFMLFLSFCHMIFVNLFHNKNDASDKSIQIYKKLVLTPYTEQQPFNFLYYNQQDLVSLYSSGHLTTIPKFNYGSDLTKRITKQICFNNPQVYVRQKAMNKQFDNENKILFGLIEKGIIGMKGFDREGQQLLKQINNPNNPIYIKGDKKLKQFVKHWQYFYEIIGEPIIEHFKEDERKKLAIIEDMKVSFEDAKFLKPFQRPDSLFRIIEAFLKLVRNKKEELENKMSLEDRQFLQQQLKLCLDVFLNEDFLTLLSKSDPTFRVGKQTDEHISKAHKKRFEDELWKLYAQVYLLQGTLCLKIKEQEKDGMTERRAQDYEQQNNF